MSSEVSAIRQLIEDWRAAVRASDVPRIVSYYAEDIVAFDAIGLLFYIIPGLIAFGVDFATGAIYLPDAKYSVAPEVLKDAVGADGKVDNRKLKAILEREIGRELPLDDPRLIRHSGSVEQLAAYGLKPAA